MRFHGSIFGILNFGLRLKIVKFLLTHQYKQKQKLEIIAQVEQGIQIYP